MGDIVLETKRLVLRTITESDAALQDRHLNTPAVMRHLGGVKEPYEIEAKHAKMMQLYAREGFSFLMLIEKASGDVVGHAGIKRVDHPAAPNQGDHEIGWLVREDRWRRGYAEEAMRAVLEWAFGHRVNAPHVVALTDQPNIGSWKLMQKLRMERRKDLDFIDPEHGGGDDRVIQYSLTKAQWETTQ
ncbi:MAG: GNAT family N-acetyltransferase [Pseudomonadota bacterium]